MKNISLVMIICGLLFSINGNELAEKINQRNMPVDSKVDLIMTLKNTLTITIQSIRQSN